MNKIESIIEELREDGFDNEQIEEFLEDGEAMAKYGITDEDQADVEEAYARL